MNFRVITALLTAASLNGYAIANPKTPAPCVVYFAVAEHDEVTVGLTIDRLNKPQNSWYQKDGDRKKFAGICYVPKVADAPANAPLYLILWGEHLMSRPYSYSYQTTERVNGDVSGTVTDNEGNTEQVSGTTTTDVPVEHTESGVSNFYIADGWLAVWNSDAEGPGGKGKGNFEPIAALHNHNRTKFTSASSSLLKDAMEQIREREKQRLAQ